MPSNIHLAIYFLIVLLIGGAVTMCMVPARAQSGMHGDGHAEHHDQYKSLVNPLTGMSCCHDQDCRPGNVWRDEDGSLRARIGNLTVPARPR